MTPEISILLPFRNAADTLPEALSGLAAAGARAELVAVDDGSSDGSAAQVRACWPGALTLLSPGPVGLVEALGRGLAACRAPVVARMDADDLAPPGRLEAQLTYLERHPDVAVVSGRVESFSPHGPPAEGYRRYDAWLNGLTGHADLAREIWVESPLAHPSVAFRRDAVLGVGGYRNRGWPEDYDLWLRCHRAGLRFGKVDALVLRWRDHPARTSRRDPRYAADAFLRCKAHHLARGPLAETREVMVWGGRVARRLGRLLAAEGRPVRARVDVDPRRIDGEAVWSPEQLAPAPGRVLLACVGSRGARDLIRARAAALGFVEGRDLLCVA